MRYTLPVLRYPKPQAYRTVSQSPPASYRSLRLLGRRSQRNGSNKAARGKPRIFETCRLPTCIVRAFPTPPSPSTTNLYSVIFPAMMANFETFLTFRRSWGKVLFLLSMFSRIENRWVCRYPGCRRRPEQYFQRGWMLNGVAIIKLKEATVCYRMRMYWFESK